MNRYDFNNILNDIARQKRKNHRWLVAISSLPLFAGIGAFGIAPSTSVNTFLSKKELHTPRAQLLKNQSEPAFRYAEIIKNDDTLASIFHRMGIKDNEAVQFFARDASAEQIRRLIPGKLIFAEVTEQGHLQSLSYQFSEDKYYKFSRIAESIVSKNVDNVYLRQVIVKSGKIESSLYAATDKAELSDRLANTLANLFSTKIDFHKDLRKNDSFKVIYESFYKDGTLSKIGNILAAEFINRGNVYRVFYFSCTDGKEGYYTEDGQDLRNAFLQSPIEFSRISSGFTKARYHPILKRWRAHKGIDYAAPPGTRVRATADGVIKYMGRKGAYGHLITIDHPGKYSTAYGHLHSFSKNIKVGSHVQQGEVIGYVGSTGLATGPHLHYELRIANVQHNPLSPSLPVKFSLTDQEMIRFKKIVKPFEKQLELLNTVHTASIQ